jgi:hypothetical protein
MNFCTKGRSRLKHVSLAVDEFQSLYSWCSASLVGEVRRTHNEVYSSFDSTNPSNSFKTYTNQKKIKQSHIILSFILCVKSILHQCPITIPGFKFRCKFHTIHSTIQTIYFTQYEIAITNCIPTILSLLSFMNIVKFNCIFGHKMLQDQRLEIRG